MIRNFKDTEPMIPPKAIALLIAMILMSAFFSMPHALAEMDEEDFDTADVVILDDPAFFLFDEDEYAIPVISSIGKENVKISGVKSKGVLVKYTIPERLLEADPTFLSLMIEAEKYIGYPYVYGAANPNTGFDCSGFVCWVFNQSGVYKTKRLGANGLYSICTDIPREEVRPGDLVFFEKTMGAGVKGITHVGIYVGNNMMIHAGDPVGFADLQSEQWAKKIYAFGRLPID